jgi:antitoxin (DNA-binding transcriptional repressor) of toxin-antitoxin stability system
MKILSVTEVSRHFRAVIDSVEQKQEEIVLVRNQKHVARLIPEVAPQNALEVFGDLYRTLGDEAADALSSALSATRKKQRGAHLRAEKSLGWLIDSNVWIAIERGTLSAALRLQAN